MLLNGKLSKTLSFVLASTLCWTALGQSRSPEDRKTLFTVMPGVVLPQVAALGNRVQIAGREQAVYTGEFTDESGTRAQLQVVHQLSGLVRLQKPASTVSFDGSQVYRAVARTDELLLETFVSDTVEGMLGAVKNNEAVRLLGRGFGPDPRQVPDYRGPRYDIYEVAAAAPVRQDKAVRVRRYYFDTQSGLLVRTRYYDPTAGVDVETRFSGWQIINGSAYPGRIDRFEGKRLVFSFVAKTLAAAPRQDPETFR